MIECKPITKLWSRIEHEFTNIFEEPLSNVEKELGCLDHEDDKFVIKNLLLLIIRIYIYHCNLDETTPTYAGVVSNIRMQERIEYEIASKKDEVENHFLKWEEILYSLSIGCQLD